MRLAVLGPRNPKSKIWTTVSFIKQKRNTQSRLEGEKLYRVIDGVLVLVLPEHSRLDIIMAYHELYLHPGMNKTKMLDLRHFWAEVLDRCVRLVLSNCAQCKVSKIDNTKIITAPMHMESSCPGELVAIDMYGPLPKCPGGSIALLVALDILSGYVVAIPLKDMKGPSFISATKKIIKKLRRMNIIIQK